MSAAHAEVTPPKECAKLMRRRVLCSNNSDCALATNTMCDVWAVHKNSLPAIQKCLDENVEADSQGPICDMDDLMKRPPICKNGKCVRK